MTPCDWPSLDLLLGWARYGHLQGIEWVVLVIPLLPHLGRLCLVSKTVMAEAYGVGYPKR
jgi:hypothetical protein